MSNISNEKDFENLFIGLKTYDLTLVLDFNQLIYNIESIFTKYTVFVANI